MKFFFLFCLGKIEVPFANEVDFFVYLHGDSVQFQIDFRDAAILLQ